MKHDGQVPTCRKCHLPGHVARSCTNVICFNCDEVGHIYRDCSEAFKCSICKEDGHYAVDCHLSWWHRPTAVVGGDDDGDDGHLPPGDSSTPSSDVPPPNVLDPLPQPDVTPPSQSVSSAPTVSDAVLAFVPMPLVTGATDSTEVLLPSASSTATASAVTPTVSDTVLAAVSMPSTGSTEVPVPMSSASGCATASAVTPTDSDIVLADLSLPPADLLLANTADLNLGGLLDDLCLSPDPSSPDVDNPLLFSSSTESPVPPTPTPRLVDPEIVSTFNDPVQIVTAMRNATDSSGVKVKSKPIGRQPGKVVNSTIAPSRTSSKSTVAAPRQKANDSS